MTMSALDVPVTISMALTIRLPRAMKTFALFLAAGGHLQVHFLGIGHKALMSVGTLPDRDIRLSLGLDYMLEGALRRP